MVKATGKVALVAGGYVLAVILAVAAERAFDAELATKPYDTSGGMYAGGLMLTFLGVLAVASLPPTLLALWFLRASPRFWNALAFASLAFAGAGLIAVLKMLVWRTPTLFDLFGVAQLLGVPLWGAAFALFALLAPTPESRRKLLAAVGLEAVIAVCALAHWFGR
jgi:hypothetical protein